MTAVRIKQTNSPSPKEAGTSKRLRREPERAGGDCVGYERDHCAAHHMTFCYRTIDVDLRQSSQSYVVHPDYAGLSRLRIK
jgi:hypothetical protein